MSATIANNLAKNMEFKKVDKLASPENKSET